MRNFMKDHPDLSIFIVVVLGILIICTFPGLTFVVVVGWIIYAVLKPFPNPPRHP